MNLEEIKGIGPKTIELLKDLNIINLYDLLTYYPYRYNYLLAVNLNTTINESGLINGTIISLPKVSYIKRNFNRLSFSFLTENKIINVTIFNRAFLKNNLKLNQNIAIIGKYNPLKNTFLASDIKLSSILTPEIEPVYHLVNGITNKQINKIILNILNNDLEINDFIPKRYNVKYNLLPKINAIEEIHHPTNIKLLKQAKLKLIYEEFFIFMFKMNYLKELRTINNNGLPRNVAYQEVEKYLLSLPFKLTTDQIQAIKDIYQDLVEPKRMNRLILGDVGSGKTIICFVAIYINYLSHYQSVLMAPTEVLALQHYKSAQELLPNLKIGLLVGSMKEKAKNDVITKIKNKELDLVIGTHAILNDNVIFANLGLVITDEQHRFGVNQRKTMQNKGVMTDVLYASATPIPRTYALSLYGDMDLSLIKTKPHGRMDIITKVKKESEISDVLKHIWAELKLGHQIYVVAPLIEDENETNLNDINKLKTNFNKAFKDKVGIAILHGKMKKTEKNQVMKDYKENKIRILISTTVIEVGIDVKNATMMIIYNADRFGLATLHQLRGRVGRNYY